MKTIDPGEGLIESVSKSAALSAIASLFKHGLVRNVSVNDNGWLVVKARTSEVMIDPKQDLNLIVSYEGELE